MSSSHEAAPSPDFLAEEVRRYHHFIVLALWLAVVTGAEIVLIFLPIPVAAVLTILTLMSAGKFFAVILWFMHLIYDKRLLFWCFFAGLALAFATFTALLKGERPPRTAGTWVSDSPADPRSFSSAVPTVISSPGDTGVGPCTRRRFT